MCWDAGVPDTEFKGYGGTGGAGIRMEDCGHGEDRQRPVRGRETDGSPVVVKEVTADREVGVSQV